MTQALLWFLSKNSTLWVVVRLLCCSGWWESESSRACVWSLPSEGVRNCKVNIASAPVQNFDLQREKYCSQQDDKCRMERERKEGELTSPSDIPRAHPSLRMDHKAPAPSLHTVSYIQSIKSQVWYIIQSVIWNERQCVLSRRTHDTAAEVRGRG